MSDVVFVVTIQGKKEAKKENFEATSYEEALEKASNKYPNARVTSISLLKADS